MEKWWCITLIDWSTRRLKRNNETNCDSANSSINCSINDLYDFEMADELRDKYVELKNICESNNLEFIVGHANTYWTVCVNSGALTNRNELMYVCQIRYMIRELKRYGINEEKRY